MEETTNRVKTRGDFHPPLSTVQEVYVDFGIRKPHAVLLGRSSRGFAVEDLKELGLQGCRIYLEDGCPRYSLYGVFGKNRVFTVPGKLVKALREAKGKVKSDLNDVFLIRELARRNPEAFHELTAQERDDIGDAMVYAYYSKVTGLITSLSNRQRAFSREFGEPLPQLEVTLKSLQSERRRTAKYFRRFDGQAKSVGVRGLGAITIAGVRVLANPARFRSVSAYLAYCGLKASARVSGRYNRHVRAVYHQLACDIIMHRDPVFYPLYLEIKADLRTRFPGNPKFRIDGMAKNRLATLLAKKIYSSLRAAPQAAVLCSPGPGSRTSRPGEAL